MTVNSIDNRKSFAGNGVTVVFSTPVFFESEDLTVILIEDATGEETLQVLATDYVPSGAANPSGGSVLFGTAPPSGFTVVIITDPALTQLVSLVPNDPLPVETAIERPLDKLTLMAQRDRDLLHRSVRLPDGDTGFGVGDMNLPSKVTRASKFLAFDVNGKPLAAAGTSADLGPVSAYIDTLLDDADEATARATLGAVSQAEFDTFHQNRIVNVKTDHSAVGDGTTDDTAALQAAIDAVEAAGGGFVYLPAGIYLISSTLVIDSDSVRLIGAGGVGNTNDTNWRQFAATTILWGGSAGGTMIQIKTPIDASRTKTLQACGLEDLLVDCEGNATAGIGVEILGLRGGQFSHVTVFRPSGKGWNIDIMSDTSNLTGGELGDVQRCTWWNCFVWTSSVGSSAYSFVLGDTNVDNGTGNVSLNSFHHCEATVYNGTAFKLHGCDSNAFYFARTFKHPAGSGQGVEFHGGSVANKRARANIFFGYCGNGPTRSVSGVVDATSNSFIGYIEENAPGKPTPVAGTPIPYITDAGEVLIRNLKLETTVPFVDFIGDDCQINFEETDAAADNQKWQIRANGEDLTIQALTDADVGGAKKVVLKRTAQAIDSMELEGGMNLNVTGVVKVDGTQVVSTQGAAVADAVAGGTIDVEARAALNALLARLRDHGLIAT